jgi:hypothetical protein
LASFGTSSPQSAKGAPHSKAEQAVHKMKHNTAKTSKRLITIMFNGDIDPYSEYMLLYSMKVTDSRQQAK